MPKINKEHQDKMKAGKAEAKSVHSFDLCGWEVWIDPLNFSIKKGPRQYYYSTFLRMLEGLGGELENKAVKNAKDLNEAIVKVEKEHNHFIEELTKLVDIINTKVDKDSWQVN